ncbi:MAG TPA: lipid-A-disaccharide synthase N-terminal domain-containing protein [Phycisphaerae bacterium]|nr:lipid-A-disaccharide synthase N-terminal domain-containing protein [Phycisphaerae bacterium]
MSVDLLAWVASGELPASGGWWSSWSAKVWASFWDPLFVFGMAAQGVFFLRFVVQWIVSERQGRSTIPIAFWYLSLVGSALIFVYAILRADPVFMLAQVLACVIYVRNLMLISRQRRRIRPLEGRAGSAGGGEPVADESAKVT